MASKKIAVNLDLALEGVGYQVLNEVMKFLPKFVRRDDPSVSTAAVVMASLVLRQALRRQFAEAPLAEANFKLIGLEINSNLRERIGKSGQDTSQLLTLVKRLNGVASVGEAQCWMIPYLLTCCGVKVQRAEDLQPEVIRTLQALVGQVGELPFLLDAGTKKPRDRKWDGSQEALNF